MLLSDAHGEIEKEKVKAGKILRPHWTWNAASSEHEYKLGGTIQRLGALTMAEGCRARVVGLPADAELNVGLEHEVHEQRADGRWRLQGRRGNCDWWVAEAHLQPVTKAQTPRAKATAASTAAAEARAWLGLTHAEAAEVAVSLEKHAEEFRRALQPRKSSTVQEAAWRDARKNFESVGELRAALATMDKGKTGRCLAVEQLLEVDDHVLAPWLSITELIFAGEAPDRLKLGTVSPLPKDLARFRPVTLLEPIYVLHGAPGG